MKKAIATALALGIVTLPGLPARTQSAPLHESDTIVIPENQCQEYVGPRRDFRVTDLFWPRADYAGFGDIDASLVSSWLFLAHDKHFALFERTDRQSLGTAATSGPKALPDTPNAQSPYFGGLKFRRNTFFVRIGRDIFRRDPETGAWQDYFKGKVLFSQFEILPDGKVLIICPTPRSPITVSPTLLDLEMTLSKGNENLALMELHAPDRPEKPERVFPFPQGISGTLPWVNDYPLVDRTFQVEKHFFLINSQVGQIFVYDSDTRDLRALDVPWPSLNDTFMAGLDRLRLKPPKPLKIHAYPQNRREVHFAVIRNSVPDEAYVRTREEYARKEGNSFAPLAKIFSPAERASWAWMKYCLYDVSTQTFRECRNPRLSALRLDFAEHWLTPTGDAVPLSKFGLGSEHAALGIPE